MVSDAFLRNLKSLDFVVKTCFCTDSSRCDPKHLSNHNALSMDSQRSVLSTRSLHEGSGKTRPLPQTGAPVSFPLVGTTGRLWISRELAFPEPAFNLKDQLLEMGCALRLVPALCLCQASHRIKVRGQRRSIHPLPQTFVLHFA